ncbi:MAG: hypothetical protein JO339_29895 [Alphaproteobacteria bacterium]|nr:hypothetical protein [Alphaproteobacteria bacterium]
MSFIDNPLAPDIFADEAIGFFINQGTVKITFASARVNHVSSPGPVNRVVVGRLVMSVEGAQHLAVGLFDFLKSRGVLPVPLLGGDPQEPN